MSPALWHIPTSDDEVVDIFLEEVGELLQDIDSHLKAWMSHPGDKKTLIEIRRIFHTLKGSGRMVKALDLSDMAWKVENMLNQAIAGTVPVSEAMMELVAAIRAQIPKMVEAFRNRRSVTGNGDILNLMKLADTLAAGRKPAQVRAPLVIAASGGRQQFTPYELNLKLERFMQRADEALHRSEMALQEARQLSTPRQPPQRPANPRDWSAEVDRIGEHVEMLSKDVADVRVESNKSRNASFLHESEMNQVVDKRLETRLVPMELLLIDIKRDIQENHKAVAALRRFGWLAFILSALVGGVIATGLLMSVPALG